MIRVNNLTNRLIKFQQQSIPAYGYADFAVITDMIGLSRLLNSGKISYNQYSPKEVETAQVEAKPEPVAEPVIKETPVEEKPIEKEVEPAVEEKPAEESTISEVEDTEPKSKGSRRKSKKESADE